MVSGEFLIFSDRSSQQPVEKRGLPPMEVENPWNQRDCKVTVTLSQQSAKGRTSGNESRPQPVPDRQLSERFLRSTTLDNVDEIDGWLI
jgi:hypothetical protein